MVKSSTLVFSALSSNSVFRLARQHTQPLSSDTHSSELVPQSYFTSGVDTASLLSSDAQTAYFSGNFFSEVLISILVPPHVRIPEYFTTDHSKPPTPNFEDNPKRKNSHSPHTAQRKLFTSKSQKFFSDLPSWILLLRHIPLLHLYLLLQTLKLL